MRSFLTLCVLNFLASSAQAYIDYAPNSNLQEEVTTHSYRVLPHNEHYALAVDADFFKPVFLGSDKAPFYRYDFYHGNGYWMNIRSEFKANQDLAVNLELETTHGTSSNGPTYLAVIVPHVGFTYRFRLLGFDWESRLSDIGRQTVGTGLFIEQKETDGGYVYGRNGDFTAKLMVDGTGSFRLDGGIVALDVSMWDGFIGATGFIQETETAFAAPQFMGTLYSKQNFKDGFGYGVEAGGDQVAPAGLAYLQFQNEATDPLHVLIKPQFRSYGKGILGQLPGRIQHNYVSYDQNDKPYTNLMDIFAYGDHVETYSAQVNAEFAFSSFWHIYEETEILRYNYHERTPVQAVFFRTGLKFYPFHDRQDEFGILVGNKYLIASTSYNESGVGDRTYSPPNLPDFENKPLFLQQTYLMVNFSAKL